MIDLETALKQNEIMKSVLREIAFTEEGDKIIGTSRNAAIRNFEKAVRKARIAYYKVEKLTKSKESK